MIILRIPPPPRGQHLRRHLLPSKPLPLHRTQYLPRPRLLLRRVIKDSAPVLRAHVGPLAVRRRRVVHAEEELDQALIRDDARVVEDLQRFRICISRRPG